MSHSDGTRSPFYDISLEDNLTFQTGEVTYTMQTPTSPTRRLKFNMGTKKASLISEETYKNLPQKILKEFHCEQIQVPMRDGTDIPMIIKYDRRFYNEDSPWVMFTRGANSSKSDLTW